MSRRAYPHVVLVAYSMILPYRPRRAFAGTAKVYGRCIPRTNIDLDDAACRAVMKRYHLATKRDAVNFALRTVAGEPPDLDAARHLRGSGWSGDLDEMRASRTG